MNYDQYKARFYTTVPLIAFPSETLVGLPVFRSAVPSSWDFEWVIEFLDDLHYIHCREAWSSRLHHPARRYRFSHHYGPGPRRSANGRIRFLQDVVLRIDRTNKPGEPEHLHHLNPLPHYEQARVNGLTLDTIDMFRFISAILEHRRTGQPLHEALGYTVT